MEAWAKNPTSKPAYDNSAKNRELSGILKIFSPRSASPRQTYDTCAYCHGNKENIFLGFRGGDHYEDYALPFLISNPIPENDFQGEFWPDGKPNRFNRPQALTLSGCFKAGQAVCTSCHVAHGSRNPFSLKLNITQGRTGDLLCVQCHEGASSGASGASGASSASGAARLPLSQGLRDPITAWPDPSIEQHTHHKAASAGSRCISCHMSDVNWRLLIRRRDHTFQPPVPEITAAVGEPNACTTCHDDRSPEWAARQMDQWWGDGARRQASVSLADTMYRAGSGDATVLPDLARLAVDRSQGILVRASAVEFMSRLAMGTAGSASTDAQSQTSFGRSGPAGAQRGMAKPAMLAPEQINALIGAASDPEAVVRAEAVNALFASGDRDRVITAIVARLGDPARVVRSRAAEALLAFGVTTLPGRVGELLSQAQDDYAASLQAFPDAAANHTALGWLDAERNRPDEAVAALDRASSLDPKAARPLVLKGVIAARAGKFVDAIDLWRKAKSLDPAYPNIDRLIAEAEKRKQ
jgi:predicted CXXCH cytochrome family protein